MDFLTISDFISIIAAFVASLIVLAGFYLISQRHVVAYKPSNQEKAELAKQLLRINEQLKRFPNNK